ncbi:hypothetical protein OG280_26160 [Streptomyces virginiae]|uniref:hypothetical protein n=1 Tax=Streptomyces TaxID=1883 RepID=UPI0028D8EB79|nr:hypothetical protein [Streptomyces sp. DSM 40907]
MTGSKIAVLAVMSTVFLAGAVVLGVLAASGDLGKADQLASVVGSVAALVALVLSVWQLISGAAATSASTKTVKAVNGMAAGNDLLCVDGDENEIAVTRRRASSDGAAAHMVVTAENGIAAGRNIAVVRGIKNKVS